MSKSTLATMTRRDRRRLFGGPPERTVWVRVGSWLVPLRGSRG